MLRRNTVALGGGLVPFQDWILKDPLLQNYEGWRILDNVKVTRWQALVTDQGGFGRHLDPIIDDPRLTHRQRVCRLYRWALKELISNLVWTNSAKFNLGCKTIRMRFERYRYVTDPAMCDMMVRESQKYLRDTCHFPNAFFYDYRWKGQPQQAGNFQVFPGHPQAYDHWTDPGVFIYDDLKLHRYASHYPQQSCPREGFERFGDTGYWYFTGRAFWRPFVIFFLAFYSIMIFLSDHAFFFDRNLDPPLYFEERTNRFADLSTRGAWEFEEKAQRTKNGSSYTDYDWDWVMGKVGNRANAGNFQAMQRHRLDRSETEELFF